MTTTITLETHSWPVRVTINDRHESDDGKYKHEGKTVQLIDPETKTSFHITSSRSIAFDELPIPAPESEGE